MICVAMRDPCACPTVLSALTALYRTFPGLSGNGFIHTWTRAYLRECVWMPRHLPIGTDCRCSRPLEGRTADELGCSECGSFRGKTVNVYNGCCGNLDASLPTPTEVSCPRSLLDATQLTLSSLLCVPYFLHLVLYLTIGT